MGKYYGLIILTAFGYVWSIYLASLDSATLLSILLLFLWQLVCLICDCLIYAYKCSSNLKRFLYFVFAMIYGVWGYTLIWNPYGMLRWQARVHIFEEKCFDHVICTKGFTWSPSVVFFGARRACCDWCHYYILIQNPTEKSDSAWIYFFKLTKNHKDTFFFVNVATSVA